MNTTPLRPLESRRQLCRCQRAIHFASAGSCRRRPPEPSTVRRFPRRRNSSNSSRTEFHFTDATELRYSICFERHRLRRHSNPGSSPSSVSNGAVNLTAYFQNGWLAIAPDAFSYGPQILQLFPTPARILVATRWQIYGYGFGSDPTKIAVKIGGANAAVQKVENVTTIASSLSLDSATHFHSNALPC